MVLHEHAKSVEDLRSQLYRMTITKETAFYHLQAKRAELIHYTARLCGHQMYYDRFWIAGKARSLVECYSSGALSLHVDGISQEES